MNETRLREALEVIRERGWTKGFFVDGQGHVCAIGGLAAAWEGDANAIIQLIGSSACAADHQALVRVACEQWPGRQDPGSAISQFNDRKATTLDDIERCFEKAAIEREAEV